jgi:splicing factor 3B subunit 3
MRIEIPDEPPRRTCRIFLIPIVPTETFLLRCFRINTDYCFLFSIFQIPKLGMKLKQDSIPLSLTPRRFISHPKNHHFYLIEGDHRVLGDEAANKRLQAMVRFVLCVATIANLLFSQTQAGQHVDQEMLDLPAEIFGRPKAAAGNWASAIRIIDPVEVMRIMTG